LGRDDLGGVRERLGRLELTFRVDDLGPLLALSLGLLGHRALHRAGELDVLDLDHGDFDSPGLGLLVDDLLQVLVDLVAVRQELIESRLAERGPQRRLGDLRGRVDVVQNLSHRSLRIDHLEVDDGIDLCGHVVVGDDLLGRHFERDDAHVHLDQPVDPKGDDEVQPRLPERD